MAEECTHDCSTCGKGCAERKEMAGFGAPLNAASKVGKVIAVASGKGGVGKSFVTTMLAVAAMRRGLRVGILDADITGPSIPKGFGLAGASYRTDDGIEPTVTTGGIRVVSLNMLVEDPSDPVVWRGPVIAGCVKQFWTDVHWGVRVRHRRRRGGDGRDSRLRGVRRAGPEVGPRNAPLAH